MSGTTWSRETALDTLAREPLDLLVIGGGINGAGIAREAVQRGLRVGLVDKGDFGSGTSSRSSKLIHGGFRYLELGDLRLVRAACRERDLLRRRLAPHLVRPLPFVFPVFAGDRPGFFTLAAGLWLYDLLAAFRNVGRHRLLSARRTLEHEPGLRSSGLRGAGFYYDCWTDDARLTLETVLSACGEGAVACNYLAVTSLLKTIGRIDGVRVGDVLGDRVIEVRAATVVNACGPWVDEVRRLDDPEAQRVLRLTKGAHLLVPRARVGNRHAVVLRAPADGRVMFAIPWEEHTLVGTTDTDYSGSLEHVTADRADVDYLLEAVNHSFPAANLAVDDVVSTYAGLRPLVAPPSGSDVGPSAVSREEEIFVSRSGLISLAGGKLTTYRRVAIDVVERVVAELRRRGDRRPFPPSATHRKPLLGGGVAPDNGGVTEPGAAASPLVRHLEGRYGSRLPEVLELLDGQSTLRQPLVPSAGDLRGEVRVAAAAEMAVRVEDVLRRRLHVGLKDRTQGLGIVGEVAALMASVLGWDERRRRGEEAAYRSRVEDERRGWGAR